MTSDPDLHILRHSLGLDDQGKGSAYRNSFVTGPGGKDFDRCQALVAEGLMIDHGASQIFSGDHRFSVTEAGKLKASASSSASQSPRGKRRYLAFLDAKDAYPDLTFREYLTHPHFASSRANA